LTAHRAGIETVAERFVPGTFHYSLFNPLHAR